jgi:tetratricopeptide (TPR) repeat protein
VEKVKASEFYRSALAVWPRDGQDESGSYWGDLAIARENLVRAIELDPECAGCYFLRGEIYHIDLFFESALKDYNEAIRLDPNFAVAYESRAIVYDWLGDSASAVRDAEIACGLGECEAKILFDVFGTEREDAGEDKKNENRH